MDNDDGSLRERVTGMQRDMKIMNLGFRVQIGKNLTSRRSLSRFRTTMMAGYA